MYVKVSFMKLGLPFLLILTATSLWGEKPAKITWSPDKVETELGKGESVRFPVKFKSNQNISSAELWLTPSLNDIVTVEPAKLQVEANKEYEVILNISGEKPGFFEGTLHVRDGTKTLAEPLNIKVEVKSVNAEQNLEDELCSSGKTGAEPSEDWKRWKEWTYEKPSIEDMEQVASEWGEAFVFEFKSVWDEMFKKEPKAPDGFFIFHIAIFLTSATEASITLEAPEGVRVLGGSRFDIGEVPVKEVRSFYVPIKLCGNFGTFPIIAHFEYRDERGFRHSSESILLFIIREHRRSIKAMKLHEYVQFLEEERLKKFKKREGAEFYPPIAYAYEPTPLGEVNLVSDFDPLMPVEPETVYYFAPYLPSNVDIEFEETATEIEPWETQNQQSPRLGEKSWYLGYVKECYNFVGRVILIGDKYTLRDVPLAGATVIAYDDDGATSPDDFICKSRTDSSGRFVCGGCAEDFLSRPDPYIIVYASNGKVTVVSPSLITFSQFIASYEGLKGATYDLGTVRVGGTDINSPLLGAFWVFRFANIAYLVNLGKAGMDIGDYTIVYPEENISTYDRSKRRIYINFDDASDPSVIGHEFGHALMDRLYSFKDWPSPPNVKHSLCYNDLKDQRQREGLAFAEGFANAVALVTFSIAQNRPVSHFCWDGLPWDPAFHRICVDLEPSTIRDDDDNSANRWNHHWCGDCGKGSNLCFPGQENEGYVASAIWDLYDDYSDEDRSCFFHENAGRKACDSAKFSWTLILGVLPSRPQNYFQFVSSFHLTCDARNDERKTSRFNNIFTGDYLTCVPIEPPGGGGSGGGGGCSSSAQLDLQLFSLIFLILFRRWILKNKNRKICFLKIKRIRNFAKFPITLLTLFLISCSENGIIINGTNGNKNCFQESPVGYVVTKDISYTIESPVGLDLRGGKVKMKGEVIPIGTDEMQKYVKNGGNGSFIKVRVEEGTVFPIVGTVSSIPIEAGSEFYVLTYTSSSPKRVTFPVEIGKKYTFEYIYGGPWAFLPSDLKIFDGDKLIFWGKTSFFFEETNLLAEYELEEEFFEKFNIRIAQGEEEICKYYKSTGTYTVFYLHFSCGGQEIRLKPGEQAVINCFDGKYSLHLLTSQRVFFGTCIDCSDPDISFYLIRF